MLNSQTKALMAQEIDQLLFNEMEEIRGGKIEEIKICGSCQSTCKQCNSGGK